MMFYIFAIVVPKNKKTKMLEIQHLGRWCR